MKVSLPWRQQEDEDGAADAVPDSRSEISDMVRHLGDLDW